MGFARVAIAAVLGVACAVLVACGSTSSSLIPRTSAGTLLNDLNALSSAVASQSCSASQDALSRLTQDVAQLPANVDGALLARVQSGVDNLSRQVTAKCAPASSSTTTPTTTSTTTSTSTSTPTSTPTTTPTTTPSNGGGTSPGGQGGTSTGTGGTGGTGGTTSTSTGTTGGGAGAGGGTGGGAAGAGNGAGGTGGGT